MLLWQVCVEIYTKSDGSQKVVCLSAVDARNKIFSYFCCTKMICLPSFLDKTMYF